jgi:hypothetical protein
MLAENDAVGKRLIAGRVPAADQIADDGVTSRNVSN